MVIGWPAVLDPGPRDSCQLGWNSVEVSYVIDAAAAETLLLLNGEFSECLANWRSALSASAKLVSHAPKHSSQPADCILTYNIYVI